MYTFLRALDLLFQLIEVLIIIRIFMNIFRVSFNNLIGRIILELTEPILAPSRNLLYKLGWGGGMIDFSPWISILLLRIIYAIVYNILV